MNGICAPVKETPERPLTPFRIFGHSEETVIWEAGSRPSPDRESARALILDFLASKALRNVCCLEAAHFMVFYHSSPF